MTVTSGGGMFEAAGTAVTVSRGSSATTSPDTDPTPVEPQTDHLDWAAVERAF